MAEINEDDGSSEEVPDSEKAPQDQFFDAANFPHLREVLELVENMCEKNGLGAIFLNDATFIADN